MSLRIGPRIHMGEADLLRYLDRQLDREGLRRARLHLAGCPQCMGRLAELERHAAAVRGALAAIPVETPDAGKRALALAAMDRTRFRRPGPATRVSGGLLRVAAVALLALLGATTTQSGRAWVSDRVEAAAGDHPGPFVARVLAVLDTEAPAEPPAAPAPPVAVAPRPPPAPLPRVEPPRRRAAALPPGATAPVRFTPDGPEVAIRFASLQRGGSATLWLAEVPEATAQISAGHTRERIVPAADGVRIQNRPGSRAHYVLTVPVRFRMVRVQVGDHPETLIPVSRSKRNWIWTINLQETADESAVAASDSVPPG
jgi:hypothetical protein